MLDPFSLLEEDEEVSQEFQADVQKMPAPTFWGFISALILAQVGIAAVSLGLLYAGILGQWTLGGVLFAVGVVALVATVIIYRWHKSLDLE